MTKIIAKNVKHRYSPRVPNRTEPREFDRYSIYIANNHCKVDLWSVYKKGEEILYKFKEGVRFKPLEYFCEDMTEEILEEIEN